MVRRDQARRLAHGLADELAATASPALRAAIANEIPGAWMAAVKHGSGQALLDELEEVVWRACEVAELDDRTP